MGFKILNARFRKRFRRGQKQVEAFGTQTEQSIEKNVYSRFERLRPVRRFVIGWLLLLVFLISGVLVQTVLLSGYYQTFQPVPGGKYIEGVLGRFTTANPLFASGDVNSSVSHLLFSGLFTYDGQNRLVGDLARDYSVDARGTTYTVHLRPHLTWHDGRPLTARDVVYTYQTIQNPDVQSPLLSSWQGITVSATNDTTIMFKLPGVLASFPYNLTTGIVPQHVLGSLSASALRTADFNTVHPIGSGPFVWQGLQVSGNNPKDQQEQIALLPFTRYHGGQPKLQQFIVRAYTSQTQLAHDFKTNQLIAVEGFNDVPGSLQHDSAVVEHSLLLSAANMVFFKTTSGPLADKSVRQALVASTNVPAIISSLHYQTHQVREPLLQGQLAYDPATAQSGFNAKGSTGLLDQDGWVLNAQGLRAKDGKPLRFTPPSIA